MTRNGSFPVGGVECTPVAPWNVNANKLSWRALTLPYD